MTKMIQEKLKEEKNIKEWKEKESERCKVKINVSLEATTAKDRKMQIPHHTKKKAKEYTPPHTKGKELESNY